MTLPGQAIRVPEVETLVDWGEPEGDVRHIEIFKNHAVYVIEERPKKVLIKYDNFHRCKVHLPWRYFFVKVRAKTLSVPADSGAYIFFASRRARSLRDLVLLVPFLPNLFAQGGICPDHSAHYRGETPLGSARVFIRWFYKSSGNWLPGKHLMPSLGTSRECFLGAWEKLNKKKAEKIKWKKAFYRSIGKAAKSLSFAYWKRGKLRDPSEKGEQP